MKEMNNFVIFSGRKGEGECFLEAGRIYKIKDQKSIDDSTMYILEGEIEEWFDASLFSPYIGIRYGTAGTPPVIGNRYTIKNVQGKKGELADHEIILTSPVQFVKKLENNKYEVITYHHRYIVTIDNK